MESSYLERDEKLESYFSKVNIAVNGSGISDVIKRKKLKKDAELEADNRTYYKSAYVYRNMMTNRISTNLANVVRDRQFIVSDDPKSLFGFYVFLDEEKDFLGVVLVKPRIGLRFKWAECGRFYISKTKKPYSDGYIRKAKENKCVDICGQTIYHLDIYGNYHDYILSNKSIALSTKYFGPTNARYGNRASVYRKSVFANYYEYLSLMNMMNSNEEDDWKSPSDIYFKDTYIFKNNGKKMYKKYDGIDVRMERKETVHGSKDIPKVTEIPEKAQGYMKHMADILIKNNGNSYNAIGIIQNIGNQAVMRIFAVVPKYKCCHTDREIEYWHEGDLVEIKRYDMSPRNICERTLLYEISTDCSDSTNIKDVITVWMDDLDGTGIEYYDAFYRSSTEIIQKILDEDNMQKLDEKDDSMKYEEFDEKFISEFMVKRFGFPAEGESIACMTCKLASEPLFEKLFKVFKKNKVFLKELCGSIFNYITVETGIEQMLGPTDSKKKALNEILMAPKGLLNMCMESGNIELFSTIKEIFDFGGGRDYFMRMNKADLQRTVDMLGTIENLYDSDICRCLNMMVVNFGCKSWIPYIQHIISMDDEEMSFYCEYLDAYNYILERSADKEILKTCQWNIKGKDLIDTVNSLTLYTQFEGSEEEAEELKKKYADMQKKLFKYKFSYTDYVIRWPKTPEDLITEGIYLRHCVKGFINIVGNATTILFIRKKENPDKPYFTLEIRDGAIRQCHGFDNKNVKEDSGLDRFLQKFCEAKNIQYNLGNLALNL